MSTSKCIAIFLVWFFAFSGNVQSQECSEVLKGMYDYKSLKTNYYNRLVVASKLAQKTKTEADNFVSTHAEFPIEGIPVGGGFTGEQFKSWQNEMSREFNLDLINSHSSDIYLATVNENVVNKWFDCMQGLKGHLSIVARERDENRVLLRMKWSPVDKTAPQPTRIDFVELEGASAGSAEEFLKKGAMIEAYREVAIPLKRIKCKPLWLVMKVQDDENTHEVYLPAKKPIPSITQRIKVEGKSFYKGGLQRTEISWIDRGGQLKVYYNEKPGGPHGHDSNSCSFNKAGYIQASSKDSALSMSNDGGIIYDVGEISTSEHNNFKCECKILEKFPAATSCD